MNSPLKNLFQVQISSFQQREFQAFIDSLFLLSYGESNFTPLRKTSDEGCDGICLPDECVLAVYGPARYQKDAFTDKANSDFSSYEAHWKSRYKNWRFIVNHSLAPHEIKHIHDLYENAEIWGLEALLAHIEERLTYAQIRKLAQSIGIDVSEFLAHDYLDEILTDLLTSNGYHLENIDYKPRGLTDIGDKMSLNYTSEELEEARTQYEYLVEYFKDIDSLLRGYETDQVAAIKLRVISDFNRRAENSFKDKFEDLVERYLEKYAHLNDDDYNMYIRAVLLYLFEQCLIGKKDSHDNASS